VVSINISALRALNISALRALNISALRALNISALRALNISPFKGDMWEREICEKGRYVGKGDMWLSKSLFQCNNTFQQRAV
jgi:hypothetical protein